MQMDILVLTPRPRSSSYNCNCKGGLFFSDPCNISLSSKLFTTFCSRKPSQSSDNNDDDKNDAKPNKSGGKFSTDWDKAWSSFKNQGKKKKKSLTSQFSPNKYVSWNPRRLNYPLSEEVDPIKRTERSNLMLWTSPKFTLGGAIVIVSVLLIYTLFAPVK